MNKINALKYLQYLKLNKNIGIIFSLILWIYLIARAYTVPFLHDEIMTFWYYINPGNYLPFLYNIDINAANNHILNSFISSIFYKLSGHTPIVLRTANLIFIPLYCFYAYKIADVLKNKYLAHLLFLCLLFVHSIVEFMALSRGYGMSFALLMGSLWYLIKILQTQKMQYYVFLLFFLVTSISANISLLNTAILITGLLIINILISRDTFLARLYKSSIIILIVLSIAFFAAYSFALKEGGALYYGTHEGFWQLTVNSLMKALFGYQSDVMRFAILFYLILIIIILIVIIIKHFSLKILNNPILVFPVLLLGNIVAVLLLDYLFNVNYPEDRSGFHFYYFFIFSVFFLTDKLTENDNMKLTNWIILPFLLIPLHFIFASNLTHIAVYKEDRVPSRFYKTIESKTIVNKDIPTIGAYFGRTLVFAYQNYLYEGNIGKIHDTDYPSLIPDYLIVKSSDYAIWNLYYNAIDYDKVSAYHLLERKNKLNRHTIYETDKISTNGIISDEYFNLSQGNIDSLTQTALFFEYDMDIESTTAPFETWIVLSVSDSSGATTAYEYIPLNWTKPEWNAGTKHYHNGQLLTNLPLNSKKYVTYLWNMKKIPFSVTNAKLSIKKLSEK